ncbi:SRPBCC domain-containing protein [Frigidibacter sp. ROC022]|uniref:SRPBCC domain-containing protein n=1 Tax=Frigidibacter sp. ROC022 TaxID=2971796 RepID=UPI00215AE21C|nr:SRPBCC domain-containing protein [Frigidibacter sp. ROC022]MCR8726797.1 SRPBCC domain-containing protein [Frigidibacter sp. ROC022]
MIPPHVSAIDVPCNAETAWRTFAEGMPRWWPLEKRSMARMGGSAAEELTTDVRIGGRIVETGQDGSLHHWGTFRKLERFSLIEFDFHMGLPADQTGQVTVTFEPLDDRTRVTLKQWNWEGYGDMAEMMRKGYGSSWALLFEGAYAVACSDN